MGKTFCSSPKTSRADVLATMAKPWKGVVGMFELGVELTVDQARLVADVGQNLDEVRGAVRRALNLGRHGR